MWDCDINLELIISTTAQGGRTLIVFLQGNFNESLAMFLCNGGKGHSGEFVYIRDDREVTASVEYFSLCEVQIFGMEGKFTDTDTG